MKIAVINFSGNVGKTTIARHLLLPRIDGAELFSVESLNAAADLIANAKFPVMISGGGVVMGDAFKEAIALAERIGMDAVKTELQTLAFTQLEPEAYGTIQARLNFLRGQGAEAILADIG